MVCRLRGLTTAPRAEEMAVASDGRKVVAKEDIISYREGEIAGIHTITYDSEEDTLSVTHSAKSRRGLALGAVLAAEWRYHMPRDECIYLLFMLARTIFIISACQYIFIIYYFIINKDIIKVATKSALDKTKGGHRDPPLLFLIFNYLFVEPNPPIRCASVLPLSATR